MSTASPPPAPTTLCSPPTPLSPPTVSPYVFLSCSLFIYLFLPARYTPPSLWSSSFCPSPPH
jgi:hypothetical protein